jgi:ribonuclease Z
MARLIILGSAAAVTDATHDNTHFLLQGDHGSLVLVDCGGNPAAKLPRFNLDLESLGDLILTHFHPDHVYGLPNLLMQMWLLGRKNPLRIYGLHHCLYRVRRMMDDYQWRTWPNFFPVTFHTLPERDNAPVLNNGDFGIAAWPTKHFIPTIGLRIDVKTTQQTIAYSGDTEPIPGVVDLARAADLLLHEAAGEGFGHSSAAQAGEVASEAGVKRLVLIHYKVGIANPSPLVDQARTTFDGPVELADDNKVYTI